VVKDIEEVDEAKDRAAAPVFVLSMAWALLAFLFWLKIPVQAVETDEMESRLKPLSPISRSKWTESPYSDVLLQQWNNNNNINNIHLAVHNISSTLNFRHNF
jgi:hypothetical protein